MKEGWEEDEFVVLHFEATAAFVDAAFAQDEDLFAARESIDDDSPLFEGRCHGVRSCGNNGTMANRLDGLTWANERRFGISTLNLLLSV